MPETGLSQPRPDEAADENQEEERAFGNARAVSESAEFIPSEGNKGGDRQEHQPDGVRAIDRQGHERCDDGWLMALRRLACIAGISG
jgi:hypothetical protein